MDTKRCIALVEDIGETFESRGKNKTLEAFSVSLCLLLILSDIPSAITLLIQNKGESQHMGSIIVKENSSFGQSCDVTVYGSSSIIYISLSGNI